MHEPVAQSAGFCFMEGWIKIHRKMKQWGWADDPFTLALFVHLLLGASYRHTEWKGEKIKPGQVITGYPSLSRQTGMSIKRVRVALGHLKWSGEVAVKITNKYSVITIRNWSKYQEMGSQKGSQRATSEEGKEYNTMYHPESEEPVIIKEGDPTPVTERAAKYPKPLLNDMSKLITKYLELYVRYIGKTIPYVNRGAVLRLMADPMRHYGYERMEQLLDAYIASDDKYFRSEKWNIMTFLSNRTLNKLEQ